jgi:hypothetical protein
LQAELKQFAKQLACKIPRYNLHVIARLWLHRVTCAVPAGRLDAELLNVTKRVTNVLQMLPKNITPVNLEELRRVKQQLVELESRAENIV